MILLCIFSAPVLQTEQPIVENEELTDSEQSGEDSFKRVSDLSFEEEEQALEEEESLEESVIINKDLFIEDDQLSVISLESIEDYGIHKLFEDLDETLPGEDLSKTSISMKTSTLVLILCVSAFFGISIGNGKNFVTCSDCMRSLLCLIISYVSNFYQPSFKTGPL